MSTCISEPLSYMRLERYALGELPTEETQRVAAHLDGCAVCRACYERVRSDGREQELMALSVKLGAQPLPAAPRRKRSWPALAAAASVACAVYLMLQPKTAIKSPDLEPPTGTKGGALALEVVRMDAQGQLLEPTHFAAGDRFKLLFSCPEGFEGTVRVLAFQSGEVFEPVPAQELTSCGNRRPLSGAWQFDGAGAVDLCVVFSRDVPYVCARIEPQGTPSH